MSRYERLKGVMPPIITPFRTDYEVNEEALRELIDFEIEGGVHGLIPCGSTGEFAKLSDDERKKVIDITVDQANGRVPVLAGCAAPGTREAKTFSKYAENAGADGIFMGAPYYGTLTDDEIFAHYEAVAKTVNIPLMVYNNPWTTRVDIQPHLLARLAEIQNIRHVKDSSGDSKRAHEIIRFSEGKMTVFAGTDDNPLEYFVQGAKGWVAGIANFLPELSSELYELAVEKGDFAKARELYYRLVPIGVLLESGGKFVQYTKAGVEIRGISAGPPRMPLLPITDAERRNLKNMIDYAEP